MITSIDLVVVEKSIGIIFLCQLKHQGLHGADLHAKYVQITRLKKQAPDWLTSMNSWLSSITEIELRKSLRITKHVPKLTTYKLFIIKRYAYPFKELLDEDTAYYNRAQFIHAIQLIDDDKGKRKDSISSLVLKLKTLNQEANIEYLHEPTPEWMIKNLTFSLEQER